MVSPKQMVRRTTLSAVIRMSLFVAQAVARVYVQHGDYNENNCSCNKYEIEHACLP